MYVSENRAEIDISSLLLLHEITERLEQIDRIEDLCWALTDWVGELCGLDDCVVYLRVGNILTQMSALGEKRVTPDSREIVDRIGLPVGSGIVGAAAANERPIYVPDIRNDERYIADVYPGASEYAVPLIFRGELLGVLDCECREIDGFSDSQRQLLRTLAVLAQPHVAELLRKPNYQTLNYSDVIGDLAHNTVGKSGDLNTIFANITERATRTLRVSRSNIWLFDEAKPNLLVCADQYEAQTSSHTRGQTIQAEEVPAYVQALREERVILAIDARTDPRTREFTDSYLTPNGIHSMLDAPIRLDSNVVGVLCLEQMHNQRDWTEEEANFVGTLADFATIALASHKKNRC
ncbi:MAG: GAF domain-containing protein [Pseudomonadota bacterium]